jgi:hypothetical protein
MRLGRVDLLAIAASFATYFSVYAWRKPFTAAAWGGPVAVWGVDEKLLYVVAQVLGYAVSKFLGVKLISEVGRHGRARAILGAIGLAHVALVAFAVLPLSGRLLALFVNGLALGLIWGLVYGYLEGRRTSDLLGAGLSASFILASGFVKSVGAGLLSIGVPDAWMPSAAAAVFILPLGLGVLGLTRLPPPTPEEEAARVRRVPMDAAMRRAFVLRTWPGLVPLIALYVVLTALRDYRDNWAPELWAGLGVQDATWWMTVGEIPVAFAALAGIAALQLAGDGRRGLFFVHGLVALGAALVLGSVGAYTSGWIGGVPLMVTLGLGLYVAYVPFGCALFDRLVAALGTPANAGFLVYLADAFGYVGAVSLLLYRTAGAADAPSLDFFLRAAATGAALALVCVGAAWAFWSRTTKGA